MIRNGNVHLTINGNVYLTITELERRLPIYLTCVGKWKNQYPITRQNDYPDYQWIQCTSGQGVLKSAGMQYSIKAGQGMLLYPYEAHEYYATEEPWGVWWLSFNGTQAPSMLRTLQFEGTQVMHVTHPEPLIDKFALLQSRAALSEQINSVECSGIVYNMILDLYRYGALTDIQSRQRYYTQLTPALKLIEEKHHLPLTLGDIASSLGVSEQHTCLLFQKTFGMRPFAYVTQVRLRKAKELLLRAPELPVSEVARSVGYEHTSYFIHLFKQKENRTPQQFRNYS
ncbi:AraC family transcriptional regulator [Paenibacillus allorhizosphaerae]|uniref:HTH-type transcriptional activator RhaR n=1 Tax=Paenibacillus allorhizosphaerae TaxID=2849866 RepID=A0ABN7TE44_9BACL|nr:AraC family transcriptional regulator [Paenibacillus allorhizosphaerae]CAG7627030.1 HTH-type transcriptional activator RhaR [Paenibacillus allorhizosphaerae]